MPDVGDKYVIELDSHMTNKNGDLWGVKGFKSLVFDQNGLDKLTKIRETNKEAYQRGYNDGQSKWDEEYETEKEQEAYQSGMEVAWSIARKIISLCGNNKPLFAMFGEHGVLDIINHNSVQEAISKMAKYEYDVKVGDEIEQVANSGVPVGGSCIITSIGDGTFTGINQDGKSVVCSSQPSRWWRKTGRSFPQIAEVLKAMQEGTES